MNHVPALEHEGVEPVFASQDFFIFGNIFFDEPALAHAMQNDLPLRKVAQPA